MRAIEIEDVKIHLEEGEDPIDVLKSLLKPLNNKEIAAMLGVCERTVIRWKDKGKLPTRGKGQIFVMDMLKHIAQKQKGDDVFLRDGQ